MELFSYCNLQNTNISKNKKDFFLFPICNFDEWLTSLQNYRAEQVQNLLVWSAHCKTKIFIFISNNRIFQITLKKSSAGTSLTVQWLRLGVSASGGTGSIPDRGTKIPYATRWDQKKKSSANLGIKGITKMNFNLLVLLLMVTLPD